MSFTVWLLDERRRTRILQISLLLFGVTVLAIGLCGGVSAQPDGMQITYNDTRFAQAVNAVLTYLEGSLGALIMVIAGLAAIISSAFGQYRAAVSLLVVAIGAFILRSLISTFFNDVSIQP